MKYLILIGLIFLAGCSYEINKIDSYAVDNGSIDVYFCPRDNCSGVLVDFIDENVYCAFYNLELEEVISALDNEIIGNNRSGWGIMHNKFCFGNGKVITGSFNPTYGGKFRNNNNLLVIESRLLEQNYKDEFEEMKNNVFGKGDKVLIPRIKLNGTMIENYFCPEDDCALEIIEELNKAESSIKFMLFSFTNDYIANSLILMHNKGVEIKGVIEKSGETKYSKADYLRFHNISLKYDNSTGKMHHKVFIIDNKTVITGSMNPTESGDERNDENILIIHSEEIASEYLEEFGKIYK